MKVSAQISRRTDAQDLANRMVEVAERKAKECGCKDGLEVNAFVVGWLKSTLAQVAATTPAALKELEGSVVYGERQ